MGSFIGNQKKVYNLSRGSPSALQKRANTLPTPALNSSLILGREQITQTLKKLGIPENIRDFKKDVLEKIITKQVKNLPTDKDGNPVVIVFNSDRDNSTAPGRDILSPALYREMSLAGFQAEEPDQFKKLKEYLKISDVMYQAQNNLLKKGVPVLAASGAVKREALERINNGEAPPLAAAWFTATEHSVLAGFEDSGVNKGAVHYSPDADYERLLNDSVIYNKCFVVEKLKDLIENDEECLDVHLRFQPSMDTVCQNKFITSLHLNTNLSELNSYREKVQKSLGDQYLIKAGIDAEGNSLHASRGKVTQMYINIEPKWLNGQEFDGKEIYFSYMDNLIGDIAREQNGIKNKKQNPEIVTFGIADSNNDIASITSPLTKGLAIIPSNAVDIRDSGSKLMQKLSEISGELKTSLKETLIKQGATEPMAEKLSNSVKAVSQNPSRFIYFTETGNPNEKMSLSINNGYKLLHALIYLGKFTQE